MIIKILYFHVELVTVIYPLHSPHFLLVFSSGLLTAVLQAHARERNVPVDSLSFSYQVLNEKWAPEDTIHGENSFDFKKIAFQVRWRHAVKLMIEFVGLISPRALSFCSCWNWCNVSSVRNLKKVIHHRNLVRSLWFHPSFFFLSVNWLSSLAFADLGNLLIIQHLPES